MLLLPVDWTTYVGRDQQSLNHLQERNGVTTSPLYWPLYIGSLSSLGFNSILLLELVQPLTPARALRSSTQLLLAYPRTKLRIKGERAFSIVAPN